MPDYSVGNYFSVILAHFVQNTAVCGKRSDRCRSAHIRHYRQLHDSYTTVRLFQCDILLKEMFPSSMNKMSVVLDVIYKAIVIIVVIIVILLLIITIHHQ